MFLLISDFLWDWPGSPGSQLGGSRRALLLCYVLCAVVAPFGSRGVDLISIRASLHPIGGTRTRRNVPSSAVCVMTLGLPLLSSWGTSTSQLATEAAAVQGSSSEHGAVVHSAPPSVLPATGSVMVPGACIDYESPPFLPFQPINTVRPIPYLKLAPLKELVWFLSSNQPQTHNFQSSLQNESTGLSL